MKEKPLRFYRDIKLIIFCRVCGVEFRPRRFSMASVLKLCWNHRTEFYRKRYREVLIPFYAALSPEKKAQYRALQRKRWNRWVELHGDQRRQQALASYHRHKARHKGRKHRATRVIAE